MSQFIHQTKNTDQASSRRHTSLFVHDRVFSSLIVQYGHQVMSECFSRVVGVCLRSIHGPLKLFQLWQLAADNDFDVVKQIFPGTMPRSKREQQIPKGVYRLMSLTGACLSDALSCWKAARGVFLTAVLIYEERFLKGPVSLRPPSSHQMSHKDATDKSLVNSLAGLANPGTYFMKGVLMAAAILVAVEAL